MPRKKRKNLVREINPDEKFKSPKVAKLINRVMMKGKKSVAKTIVYNALDNLVEKVDETNHLEAFEKVLKNVAPLMEVKSRRVGGSTYQVPIEVRPERGAALAMRWLIKYAREKSGKSMEESLSLELIDAYNNSGNSVKKREDTHKMAEANKAFAHFRW